MSGLGSVFTTASIYFNAGITRFTGSQWFQTDCGVVTVDAVELSDFLVIQSKHI